MFTRLFWDMNTLCTYMALSRKALKIRAVNDVDDCCLYVDETNGPLISTFISTGRPTTFHEIFA